MAIFRPAYRPLVFNGLLDPGVPCSQIVSNCPSRSLAIGRHLLVQNHLQADLGSPLIEISERWKPDFDDEDADMREEVALMSLSEAPRPHPSGATLEADSHA